MRYPETDDEIDGGYWHLLYLLDNAPNDLVGFVIQKRIPIILLLPITKSKIFYFTPQDQTTKKSNKMGQKEEKVKKIPSFD